MNDQNQPSVPNEVLRKAVASMDEAVGAVRELAAQTAALAGQTSDDEALLSVRRAYPHAPKQTLLDLLALGKAPEKAKLEKWLEIADALFHPPSRAN